MKDKRIILIGAGNVAHHLAPALLKAGLNLCQIYSRSIESARELGRKTGITYTADLFGIYPDGDIYIFYCCSLAALISFNLAAFASTLFLFKGYKNINASNNNVIPAAGIRHVTL